MVSSSYQNPILSTDKWKTLIQNAIDISNTIKAPAINSPATSNTIAIKSTLPPVATPQPVQLLVDREQPKIAYNPYIQPAPPPSAVPSQPKLNKTALVLTGKAHGETHGGSTLTAYYNGKPIWQKHNLFTGKFSLRDSSQYKRKNEAETGQACPNGVHKVGTYEDHPGDTLLGAASVSIENGKGNSLGDRSKMLFHNNESGSGETLGCIGGKLTVKDLKDIAAFEGKDFIVSLENENTPNAPEKQLVARIEAEAKALAPKDGNDWA
jgi:hypothetical protein